MSDRNGNHRHASVDVIEDEVNSEGSSFYDPTTPVFAPPKQNATKDKRTWKRRFIVWCCVLALIVGGVAALYLLLRVNKVNVRVQADPRRELPSAKAESSPNNTENGLSAEAINIARQAVGPDNTTIANSPVPNPSPTSSPSPSTSVQRVLSFTDNSPAYSHMNNESSDINNSNPTNVVRQQSVRDSDQPLLQIRANSAQTLFVDDATKPSPKLNLAELPLLKKEKARDVAKVAPPAVLPVFGTMLPVRTQGVIFSLRDNSYARLELTRDCQGEGWSMPKGTLLIGRVSGSEYDRAFINVQGYIEPRTNRFVKLTGEVLGSDGGSGIPGKRFAVDRSSFKQTLSKVASGGLQVAGMMASSLTGRGAVVINGGGGYRMLNPFTDETGRILNGDDSKRSFVKVEAGQSGYVMVSDLPKETQAIDAPGESQIARAATSLNDREVMELILFGSPEELRAAMPLMSDEQKRLVVKSLSPEK